MSLLLKELSPLNKITGEINSLPDRAAMGLPESYIKPTCEAIESAFNKCRSYSVERLLAIVESKEETFEDRLASGKLLALQGDPRIKIYSPEMVPFEATSARIGLPFSDVDRLCERYVEYAIKPEWLEKECPEFTVMLKRFALAKYPVTNKEYLEFIKDNNDVELPSNWYLGRYPFEQSNHPVYSIKPKDADRYCEWLSNKTGRKFRLATEYEWEFAARGPQGYEFPWGDKFDKRAANTLEFGFLSTTPVGIFPEGQSQSGIHDLSGNVEEYVQDNYHAYPDGRIVEDDLYELVGPNYRIARGGAFNRFHDMARARRRHGGPLKRSLYAMGFRIAEALDYN